jgi:hypothetical protein
MPRRRKLAGLFVEVIGSGGRKISRRLFGQRVQQAGANRKAERRAGGFAALAAELPNVETAPFASRALAGLCVFLRGESRGGCAENHSGDKRSRNQANHTEVSKRAIVLSDARSALSKYGLFPRRLQMELDRGTNDRPDTYKMFFNIRRVSRISSSSSTLCGALPKRRYSSCSPAGGG